MIPSLHICFFWWLKVFLLALLRCAEKSKYIHGVTIARGAPSVSHLFFADDSLLFCDASIRECQKLKEVFGAYERASGQKMSVEKSVMCFSLRTLEFIKEACSVALDMNIVPCHERYLGLPTVTGKSKKKLFKVWLIGFGREFRDGKESYF